MKLIVIYGPPAAGKYTIGSKLAELTGYRFFHNHSTIDVVRPLFDDDKDIRYRRLLDNLRLEVIRTMAREDVNSIFTVGYTPDIRPTFLPRLIKAVTKYGGTLHFVQLTPPDTTLFKRINNESRHKLRKPTGLDNLRYKLDRYNFRVKIDYPSSLSLDTSKLTPLQSARRIIKEFKL
jgi:hypothetical protein